MPEKGSGPLGAACSGSVQISTVKPAAPFNYNAVRQHRSRIRHGGTAGYSSPVRAPCIATMRNGYTLVVQEACSPATPANTAPRISAPNGRQRRIPERLPDAAAAA